MRVHCYPIVAALAAALCAQNYTVSPLAYTNTAGNGGNTIPWWSATHHYMQLHGDLRGRVLVTQGISLRRQPSGTFTTAVARTVDLEMFCGPCNVLAPSATYANNYTSPATRVFNRKMANLPDWTQPASSPAPWNLVVAFDTPFVHTGASDLAWEALIYSTTSSGTYPTDAYSGSVAATNVNSGTGCIATGRTTAMAISNRTTYNANTNMLDASWTSTNGVGSVATAVLIGILNPNQPVPGLCTNLYAVPMVQLVGTSAAAGTFATPVVGMPWSPPIVGGKLHAQSACVDSGRTSGLPISASNGVETTMPDRPALVRRIWANDVNATTGSLSESYPYGLITRFTHQ
jgi:hypothetical protein